MSPHKKNRSQGDGWTWANVDGGYSWSLTAAAGMIQRGVMGGLGCSTGGNWETEWSEHDVDHMTRRWCILPPFITDAGLRQQIPANSLTWGQ